MRTIICSRHPGLSAWVKKHYPELYGSPYTGGEAIVVDVVTPEMALGNRIIGDLDISLWDQCPEYWQTATDEIVWDKNGKVARVVQFRKCKLVRWTKNTQSWKS